MKKLIIALLAIASLCALTGCSFEPETQKAQQSEDGTTIYTRRFNVDGVTIIELCRPGISYDNYTGFVYDEESLKKIVKEAIDEYMKEQGK